MNWNLAIHELTTFAVVVLQIVMLVKNNANHATNIANHNALSAKVDAINDTLAKAPPT